MVSAEVLPTPACIAGGESSFLVTQEAALGVLLPVLLHRGKTGRDAAFSLARTQSLEALGCELVALR